jgi:hypothetical protein
VENSDKNLGVRIIVTRHCKVREDNLKLEEIVTIDNQLKMWMWENWCCRKM